MYPTFDSRDQQIVDARAAALELESGPRVGDWIVFADGVERRASHVWGDEPGDNVQTSDGGSWYLGDGYVSFSGALYRGVPRSSLTLTAERRPGRVWIFHHDHHCAHNGVDVEIPFRVYRSSEVAPD